MSLSNPSRLALAFAAGAVVAALAVYSLRRPVDVSTEGSAGLAAGDVTPANVPPSMLGVWTSTRGDVMRCIEMHADGTYLMVPNTEAGDRATFHGTWRVDRDSVTWRDASLPGRPDTNPLVDVSAGHFTTVETDRSRTRFDRIAGPASTCPRA